ncbi:MAG TPA: hypothetical protein VIL97_02090 [Thermoanaerobaculia bacterium]
MNAEVGSDSPYYAAIKVGIAAVEREDYSSALKILHAVYSGRAGEVPTEGLSYYGLCLAVVEKKNKLGIDYCRKAIQSQFYDSDHYANLVKIYLLAKSRRRAVEVLEQGLKRLPGDPKLLSVRAAMRYRVASPIRFLHRDNFLNQIFGRLRHRQKLRRVLQIAVGVVLLLATFAITLRFLLRASGF